MVSTGAGGGQLLLVVDSVKTCPTNSGGKQVYHVASCMHMVGCVNNIGLLCAVDMFLSHLNLKTLVRLYLWVLDRDSQMLPSCPLLVHNLTLS